MFTIPKAYKLIGQTDLKDLSSKGYLLQHKKTGARICLMENNDENKVFYIAFRTPPEDSTGVAHILEHSVLCGSKKYPLKDPFMELAKGSLNTFLNAMTYPDKTVYPVASENDKDFANLMDVYMDAVLNPNIYDDERIFKQEGWHYEPGETEGSLIINGVVYNEMKGAYSSPDDVLEREIFKSLFPKTPYSYDSGGDPEHITDLTYRKFLKFHSRYYHPSNAFIYLYGNCDMEERLNYLDKSYLSKYKKIDIDSSIKTKKAFKEAVDIKMDYPVAAGDDTAENTYLTVNYVVGDILDPELYQAFTVLDYALLTAPGAPLRKALMTGGIGKDILGGYNNGTRQPYFTIGVKSAKTKDKARFLRVVEKTLKAQIKNGIDKDAILAAINMQDFTFREADFGSFPKGLVYGLISMDSWIYDENDPFMHLDAMKTIEELRKKVGTGYFEELTEKYLLNNTHKSILTLTPKEGLATKTDEALKKKLKAYARTLSAKQHAKIAKQSEELKARQNEAASPEALASIPLLDRKDLRKKVKKLHNRLETVGKVPVLYHDIDTKGIVYLNLLFDLKDMPKKDLFDLSLAIKMMGLLDTANYKYSDLANEVNLKTGGVYSNLSVYPTMEGEPMFYCNVSARFLKGSFDDAFRLIEEILLTTKWTDVRRMKEQLNQEILHYKARMMSSGHMVSANRALARTSRKAYLTELIRGIEFYSYMKDFADNFDERIAAFQKNAESLMKKVFRKKGLLVSCTGKKTLSKKIEPYILELYRKLSGRSINKVQDYGTLRGGNEGFKTAAAVQYVARAGSYRKVGEKHAVRLRILKTILTTEYFWSNVRVKGGAYGCMAGFSRGGDSYFVSYRDPNLLATNEIFEKTVEFVENFDADEREMTKYIIGTISGMDTPLTPSQEGDRSLSCYLMGLSEATMQKERKEVLNAKAKDIRALAGFVKAMLDTKSICVLGGEEAIEESKKLFKKIKTLT